MIDTILERGKFIRNCAHPENLAYFSQNRLLVADLFKKYRMEWTLGRDSSPLIAEKDWIMPCKKGQIFEFGPEKLGISVEGLIWTPKFIQMTKSFCVVKQDGKVEANLWCFWTPDNLKSVLDILKPIKRRTESIQNAENEP